MEKTQFDRTKIIYGDKVDALKDKTVAIIGLGGVGSFAAEAIARLGVGKLVIVDKDVVDVTNINRQLIALHSTIDLNKVDVMKERLLDINPNIDIVALKMFYNEETRHLVFDHQVDFVIDACDTISAKLDIIKYCLRNKIKFISSMGAGNKANPNLIKLSTLDKTYECKLAKVVRTTMKKEKINGKVPVVFSSEKSFVANKEGLDFDNVDSRKELPLIGSLPYIPSIFGLMCAAYCSDILLGENKIKL